MTKARDMSAQPCRRCKSGTYERSSEDSTMLHCSNCGDPVSRYQHEENAKLITAREAAELVKLSNKHVEDILEKICEKVKDAARLGETKLYPNFTLYNSDLSIQKEPFYPAKFTPFQNILVKRLEYLGFHVGIEEYSQKIGGGLGSMDDEVRHETACRMKITWG